MDELVFAVKRAFQAARRDLDRRLAPHGLNAAQLEVLLLVEGTSGIGQRDLQEELATRSASTTGLLAAMEGRSLVRREDDLTDARRLVVHTTPLGSQTLARLDRDIEPAFLAALYDGLDPEDVDTARRILDRVAANLSSSGARLTLPAARTARSPRFTPPKNGLPPRTD
jgi:DNA-binding MarR family transcriptional regulator